MILTVSRLSEEKRANPGYRAFFANGFNVTRILVLFFYEVVLEWMAAIRSAKRDVRPRGHRGGTYPFLRAAMCVVVRDLIVYGVISDLMKGRPAVYATFSSYDEVAHHSGLERSDTLEALRKLDQQFGRIERACRYAPRPYEIVVLSDHGQTQGATFLQRNGYGLADLVGRSLSTRIDRRARGRRRAQVHGRARGEGGDGRLARRRRSGPPGSARGRGRARLGQPRPRLPAGGAAPADLEEIEEKHPLLLPALRGHPHVGFLLVRSDVHGPVALGPRGVHYLADGRVDGEDPLAGFSPECRRTTCAVPTDSRTCADIMVNSFYDPRARRGLRVRGADLVPRRHGRAADAAVHPPPGCPRGARTSRSSARRRSTGAPRLAAVAPGRRLAPRGWSPAGAARCRADGDVTRHRRLHPGLERGGEPAGGARRPARGAAGRGRARRRRRLDRPHGRRRARARRRGALARDEPRPAGRDRRRLPLRARPRLRVLRPRRRRRPASAARSSRGCWRSSGRTAATSPSARASSRATATRPIATGPTASAASGRRRSGGRWGSCSGGRSATRRAGCTP